MQRMRYLGLCLAVVFTAMPALATAGVRPWFSGAIGGSTYDMTDVNDEIGVINGFINGTGLQPMDEITKGLNFGLAFGLDVGSGFAVGVGYDRLNGQSDIGDASGSIEYDLPANLVRAFGRYSFESAGRASGFLEASLGSVSSAGTISIAITGVGSVTGDVEGSGLAFEGAGGVSLWATPQFAVTGAAGYRFAKVGNVTVDGTRVYAPNGSDYSLDYSGLFVRTGITVAFAN